jgi:hypothetical protein
VALTYVYARGEMRLCRRNGQPEAPHSIDMRAIATCLVKVARPQLDQHDRLADPVVQQAGEALDGSAPGDDPGTADDEAAYGLGLAGAGDEGEDGRDEDEPGAGSAGFDVEAADTDDYEVVGAASH